MSQTLSPSFARCYGLARVARKAVHLRDLLSDEGDDFLDSQELARHQGHRSILSVPLLRENESIGVISLRRTEVQPFSDKQSSLLQTFADQAVIALGNVRLFEEVQAKTRDLTEALTYQTGSGNLLRVIASSPTDVSSKAHANCARLTMRLQPSGTATNWCIRHSTGRFQWSGIDNPSIVTDRPVSP